MGDKQTLPQVGKISIFKLQVGKMFFWVIRDKESLLQVGKVPIFKPQLNKIFFWTNYR